MLYVETVSSLMYDVSRLSVPSNMSDLFTKVKATFILNLRVWALIKDLMPDLELSFGIPTGRNFDNSLKVPLKSITVHDLLLLLMEAEDNYVETLILLYKIANFT